MKVVFRSLQTANTLHQVDDMPSVPAVGDRVMLWGDIPEDANVWIVTRVSWTFFGVGGVDSGERNAAVVMLRKVQPHD